jgi:hypothetical protein
MGLAADGSDPYSHSHPIRDVEADYAKSASDSARRWLRR